MSGFGGAASSAVWLTVLGAACAGAAGWIVSGPGVAVRRARALLGPARGSRWRRVERWWEVCRTRGELWCLPAGALVAVFGASWLPMVAAVLAIPLVARRLRARRRDAGDGVRADAVIELCAAVAGGLRAGRQPNEALLAAGADNPVAGPEALAASRFGGDVPAALRQAAAAPGAAGLSGAAACWQAAADGGAGLAAGLDRVAGALRAERRQRDELRAELAGPRSTAVVLALLPVFGLVLGAALGAAPLRVLLHTPAGFGCLVLGGLLEWAGLAWTARIVRGAHER